LDLQYVLGVDLSAELLSQALTHPSYLNENPGVSMPSYQRLEFLGDAVLGIVVSHELFTLCPGFAEGELTKRRAYVVQEESLAAAARELDLGQYLLMGKGEEQLGGRNRNSNLAAALEALIGAIFLEKGLVIARGFIMQQLGAKVKIAATQGIPPDPKVSLLELAQQMKLGQPEYREVEVSGPPNAPTYEVHVVIQGQVMGNGTGPRKLDAERHAAAQALEKLKTG
jgi:ribonuclease-3